MSPLPLGHKKEEKNMMKKLLAVMLLGTFLFSASTSFAAVRVEDSGTYECEATAISFGDGLSVTNDGSKATITNTVITTEGVLEFPVSDFVLVSPGGVVVPSAASVPGFELDNERLALVWADSETTKVQVSFRVPSVYSSGGAFRVLADSSAVTTPATVDFQVFVDTPGSVAWDVATTDQTPVALTTEAGTPEMVTLTVATDFASLAAGDTVTLNIWRDDVADGTDDLEVYYAEFYYTRKQ